MPADLVLPERQQVLVDRGLYSRTLSVRNQSVDVEERSFEAVVATDNPVTVFDYRTYDFVDEVLVADGGNFPTRMPLLPNHHRFDVLDVIGSATDFRREGGEWVGRGIVARGATEQSEVNEIWQRVADGHIQAVSIGYEVRDFIDIPPGRSQAVNGRNYTAKDRTLRISKAWRAHELSLTPIGADEMALIRSRLERKPEPKRRRSIFR